MKYIPDKTLREFIDAWGADSQIDMAIEECAELTVALKHYKRNRIEPHDVFEEIADVIFMMEELALMFRPKETKEERSIDSETHLQKEIDYKVRRTEKRLRHKNE